MNIVDFLSELRQLDIQISLNGDKLKIKAPQGALTKEIKIQLKDRKQDIIDFFSGAQKQDESKKIIRVENPQEIPLSFGQQRLWFFEEANPGTVANNMSAGIRLKGPLNTNIIQSVFEALVKRHESLRTTFYVDEDGVPYQQVSESIGFSTEFLTVEGESEYQEQKIEKLLAQEVKQTFDLNNGPLLRAKLIALPALATNECQEHVLIIGMHHIISDGLSVAILMREIAMLYWAFNSNMASPLPPLEIQYPDFSIWQRQYLEGEGLEKQLGYWEKKLTNAPMLSTFPSDMTRPSVQTSNGATQRVEFPEGFGRRLSDFANQQGVTPFIVLLAAWKMLLSRYSQQEDLCVGIPTSGRGQPALEPIIGFFVNSMVMRTDISENPTIADVLERVKQTVLDGLDNDDIPIEMAVERLKLSRNPSYTPLVQVAFQLMADTRSQADSAAAPAQAGDVTVEALKKESVSAKFDITLSMTHSDQLVRGDLEYNTDLYKPETINRISEQFKQLAEYLLVGDLTIPLNTLSLVSDNALAEEVLGNAAESYETVLPLTAMQSDMFMDNLVNPTSFQSSHGWQIHIRRPLDVALWQSCLQALSDHSAILRAKFVATEVPYLDMGYLAIAKEKNIHWEFIDHSNNNISEEELSEWITKTIYRPYDIQHDELISYYLVKLKEDHYVAITAVHHAILDGAGLNSLWVQVTDRYTAIKNAEEHQFAGDNVADFVTENRATFDTQEHRLFWRDQLSSVEPLDYTVPAPIPEPAHFITRESYLDTEHWLAVKKYCRKQRITPALYFKCLFGLAIDNYCRPDEDFSIQETMGGRTSVTADTLGCCIQEIPFVFKREVLHSNKTFADVLVSARNYQKSIKNHRKISIGVQAEMSPKGRVGFMYNFYQFLAHTEFLGQTFNPEGTPSDPANNVQFVVTEVAGELKFNLFFHQHLFADFSLLQRISALSEQIVDGQVEQLNDLQYVTDTREKTLLLNTWNDTQQPFDLSLCLHQRFEQQVVLTPDRIAAVDDGIALTYQQLNVKTNQLANYLVEKGVGRNDLVGLCADRSVEFLIGILGILKAGGAYVPMDPKYPQDRLSYMQENSAVTVLLSQKHLAEKVVAAKDAHVFYLDTDWHSIEEYSVENLAVTTVPTDRAYMIYTSGSTGLPKGAIIRHDGAVNHIEAERVDLAFPEAFSFLQTAPSSSDISVWQFLGPVICGGKTVVLDDVTNAKKLFDLVKQHDLDVVELVPVALQLLMDYVRILPEPERALPQLRWMMATGEAVSVDLVNDWLALYPEVPVVNAYGPTEAADDVIQCNIKQPIAAGQRSVPIGKPLANLNVFVVDDQLRLVPAGIPGEICISGIGVGEGYWKNPEKTAEAFVANPFECEVSHATSHSTMYRTGDLGRWLADGTIEYLDRVDNQVKIRGFRIELGEVEAAVASAIGVREGAVIVKKDMPGGAALVAFVIAADKESFSIASVRAELRAKLPDFMVPAAIELLDELPTTPAGKVDKKALEKRVISVTDDGEYCPPETIEEEKIAQIWQEVMGREKISVQSNFFDLGGHSLLATKIVSRASQVFEVHLTVRALFEFPTVKELAENIVGLLAGGEKKEIITALSRDAIASKEIRVPLSFAQQRLWLLDKIDEGSTAYNVPLAMRIKGNLDVEQLESTLTALMQRHEGLRTVFKEDEEGAYQWVMGADEFSLVQSAVVNEDAIRNAVANEILQPFDLENGPLIRASLLFVGNDSVGSKAANDYVLVIVAHHIVTDGWSMNVLGQELATLYVASNMGLENPLDDPQLQYIDYSQWQRDRLDGEVFDTHLSYWKNTLEELPNLNLPTDFQRPSVQSYGGASVKFELPQDVRNKLESIAHSNGGTLFNALMAAFGVLLSRYTGQDDFAIGTPVAGRDHPDLEKIVGFFVNTLVVRLRLESVDRFDSLVKTVNESVVNGQEHQEIPFEQIVDAVDPTRDMSRSPLFQTMLVYQNMDVDQQQMAQNATQAGDISLHPVTYDVETAKFDLTLFVSEASDGLSASLQYNTGLFERETVEGLAHHFVSLCQRLVNSPDALLADINILDEHEVDVQLHQWNDTQVVYDKTLTVHQWIAAQTEKTPNNIAVEFGDEKQTYLELDQASSQMASHLITLGVQPGDCVGFCFDRSLHIMTSVLGILKAGATYVPLDASYPEGRIRYIIEDASIRWVLTRASIQRSLPQGDWLYVDVEKELSAEGLLDKQAQNQNNKSILIEPDAERLLYLIYTSGSTGRPKGTGAYHRSEVNLLAWYTREFSLSSNDNLMLMSALGFDLTQKNLFAPLVSGATLVIPSVQEYDPDILSSLIEKHNVSWINCAPSAFYGLQDDPESWSKIQSLKYVFLGGEPINLPRIDSWLRATDCELVNSYGPTECTDIAAWHCVDVESDLSGSTLPIGRPNDNVQLYILGGNDELLPIGAVGELCIGGDSVGPGYLNNAELTGDVFIPHPFGGTSRKIYRTGDLARYRRDGKVEYLGRRDHQIKLRGFRIEVGEIQSVINEQSSVVDSLVATHSSKAGEQLVAWVVVNGVDEFDDHQRDGLQTTIKQSVANLLPSHMVPAAWVLVSVFPLTPNGKVDRKALPLPLFASSEAIVLARNEQEKRLVSLWQDVLGLSEVGVTQNFFELGGHSLLATKVIARVAKDFKVKMTVRSLFENPTIEQFASKLTDASSITEHPLTVVNRDQRVSLSFAQQRLWLLDKIEPGSVAYNMPLAIRIQGEFNLDALRAAYRDLVARHESLRTVFKEDDDGAYQEFLSMDTFSVVESDIEQSGFDLKRLGDDKSSQDTQDALSLELDSDLGSDIDTDLDLELDLEIVRLVAIEIMRPFDLAHGPLTRASVLHIAPNDVVLTIVVHHIVTDGWSMNILGQELVSLYLRHAGEIAPALKPLTYQYADFANWQREALTDAVLFDKLAYWNAQLSDVEPLALPTDKPRPSIQTYAGASIPFTISNAVKQGLESVSKKEGGTLFNSLLAAFSIVLHRYSGQHDFCIGTPVAGRENADLEKIVGFFVNTLALRMNVNPELSFGELVQQIKQTALLGYEHQDVPFEQIVQEVDPSRDMSRSPLFQVMLSYQNMPAESGSDVSHQSMSIKPIDFTVETAKYELTLNVNEPATGSADGLQASLQYNTDLFTESTAKQLIQHFLQLCDVVVKEAMEEKDGELSKPIYTIDLLNGEEKQRQLVTWNQTQVDYQQDVTIDALFLLQAEKTPNAIAVVCGENSLSYTKLSGRANQLARYLQSQDVKTGDVVGLCYDRALELPECILGILLAGATYVPLDASYPAERLAYIMDNAGITTVVTRSDIAERLPKEPLQEQSSKHQSSKHRNLICFDEQQQAIREFSVDPVQSESDSNRLLYMIYTSGSTGRPKGTGATHRAESNLLNWYCREFSMTEQDNVLLMSAIGFDLTQKNIFAPLISGATLIIPDVQEYDPSRFLSIIESEQVSWINCAPSAFYPLQDDSDDWRRLESVNRLFLGGEPINLSRLQGWLQSESAGEAVSEPTGGPCQLINSYGPTECADISAWHRVDVAKDITAVNLPIGRPNDNVKLYVLGRHQELLPIGAIGELYIGGDSVGPGYLGEAEMTAAAFFPNPFVGSLADNSDKTDKQERIYKTGDLARYRTDGKVEYLGRIDHQVKLRGYRIETGEIQSVINEQENVTDSLVAVSNSQVTGDSLVAWVVAKPDCEAAEFENNIARQIGKLLPSFMVPQYFVLLDEFPLTPNGKIDRKALPKPVVDGDVELVPAENATQEMLLDIWKAVLGVSEIGIKQDFFQLGGHSLLATQVVARVVKQTHRAISVRMLFEAPTIELFAEKIINAEAEDSNRPEIIRLNKQRNIPLSFGQKRLWYFEQMNPGSSANNMPTAVRVKGAFNVAVLQKAYTELLRRHESLRTTFSADEEGVPSQQVHTKLDNPLSIHSYVGDSDGISEDKAIAYAASDRAAGFDLEEGPLVRGALLIINDTEGSEDSILTFCLHHIISDGVSMAVLLRELTTLYVAFSNKMPSPLPELSLQYADFAQWQQSYLADDALERQLSHWQQHLKDAPALLTLPTDRPRPSVQTTNGNVKSLQFSPEFNQKLTQFSREQGVTPFMVMLLSWKLLLSKYSQQDSISVGIPTAGRPQQTLENIIGFFINSMVLNTELPGSLSITEALQRVRESVLGGFANADVPVDMVLDRLQVERNPSYTPLAQVAFQLNTVDTVSSEQESLAAEFGGLSVEPLSLGGVSAKFDMTLSLSQSMEQLTGDLEFNTDLFDESTMDNLIHHYMHLSEAIVNNPVQRVASVELCTQSELMHALNIPLSEYSDVLPLSAMQYDMFMDNLVNPSTLQSSHGWALDVHNEIDDGLWRRCLQQFSDNAPILRSQFIAAKPAYLDVGYLAIRKQHVINYEFMDVSDKGYSKAEIKKITDKIIYRPYDILKDEFIRFVTIKVAGGHYVLVAAVHHAIQDGAALNSLWEQVTDAYTSLLKDPQAEISFNDENFANFVTTDRSVMDTSSVLDFWKGKLSAVEPLDFTVPAPIPEPGAYRSQEFYLDQAHWAEVKKYCRKQRITPALYFKVLYGLMINAYCRPDSDFAIQETMAGRGKGHYTSQGCYIQEIPFVFGKDAFASSNDITSIFNVARQFQKEIKNYRLISIGEQIALSPRGRIGFMYNYYHFLADSEFLGEVIDAQGTPSDPAENIQFVVTEVRGDLKITLLYHPHVFEDFGLVDRVVSLSQQIVSGGAVTLGELQYVTDAEEITTLLTDWNTTAEAFDLSLCLHQRFEQQVIQTPDAIAIIDDSVQYSYNELNQRANQLARYLLEAGTSVGDLVGLCAERSAAFLVGILGIQKSGGAYVPMDPKYPQDRITYMRDNSAVSIVLSQQHLADKVEDGSSARIVYLDADWHKVESFSSDNVNVDVTTDSRAYMIYTSGSTGKPKGAIVRHDGAVNHIEAERKVLEFDGAFSFLQTAPSSSDISVWQFLGPVICGGKAVVLDEVTHAEKMFALVKEHKLDVVELVPVALQLLMEYVRQLPEADRALPNLRWMMATGEAVSVELVNAWLALYPEIPVVNAYGPTEAADDVIQCAIEKPLPVGQRSVPIGKPLANLSVLILDEELRLVPAGVPGEICISGVGVGEGYWNNVEKTDEVFVSNLYSGIDYSHHQLSKIQGNTIYRTGDLGRWLADGSVEYLDRVDNQVKVRGFRIELGEVEAAVSALPNVREAVVIVRDDMPGGTALAAYVVAENVADTFDVAAARATLRENLPDYMVPTAIMAMEQLPLTPAGKVDRKALPKPQAMVLAGGEYVAPRTEMESALVEMWEVLLPVEQVGVTDNFFDIGGHSLIGVRLMARVSQEFSVSLQIVELLNAPTIEQLCETINRSGGNTEWTPLVTLRKVENTSQELTQKERPIFFIHPVGGDVLCYTDLVASLPSNIPAYGLQARGFIQGAEVFASFEDMVSCYVDAIKQHCPTGPYRIAAQSLGGVIALHVAEKLNAAGGEVQRIMMFDTFTPSAMIQDQLSNVQVIESAIGQPLPKNVRHLAESGDDAWLETLYKTAKAARMLPDDLTLEQIQAIYNVAITNHQLVSQADLNNVGEYSGFPIDHYAASDRVSGESSQVDWKAKGYQFNYIDVSGDHESMIRGEHAVLLAKMVAES